MPPGQGRCDCRSLRRAIATADERIRICEAALDLLDPLVRRLQRALELLQQVAQDLGEVYELVYAFLRKGGKLPVIARWVKGDGALQRAPRPSS